MSVERLEAIWLAICVLVLVLIVGIVVMACMQPSCEEQGGRKVYLSTYTLVGKVIMEDTKCIIGEGV